MLNKINFNLLCFQLIIACRKGGTSIEDLAENFPDMIIKVVVASLLSWLAVLPTELLFF